MSSPLMAAVGRVRITPRLGEPLQGYHETNNPAEKIMDETYARLLLLEQGGRRVLIINPDLCFSSEEAFHDKTGRPLSAPFSAGSRRLWGFAAKADVVLVAATHTHYAQVTVRPEMEREILDGIRELKRKLEPVTLKAATVNCNFSAFRRPDLSPHPDVPIDRTLNVLSLLGASGTLALVANFGVHLTLPAEMRHVTSEFTGLAMQQIEAKYSGCHAFFLQGFSGDVCSIWQHGDRPYSKVKEVAGKMLEQILAAESGSQPVPVESIDAVREEFQVPTNLLFHPDRPRRMAIGGVRLGPVAVLTVGGEVFEVSGPKVRGIAKKYGLSPVLTVSHANGYCGYIPSREAFADGMGGYEMNVAPFKDGIERFMLDKLEEVCLRLEP